MNRDRVSGMFASRVHADGHGREEPSAPNSKSYGVDHDPFPFGRVSSLCSLCRPAVISGRAIAAPRTSLVLRLLVEIHRNLPPFRTHVHRN